MIGLPLELSLENVAVGIKALFLILPAYIVFRQLLAWLDNRFRSDLHVIPGPSIMEWIRANIGLSQVYHIICMDPLDTVEIFNRWRKEYGPLYQIRSPLGELVIMTTSASAIRTVNISKNDNFEKVAMAKKFVAPIVGTEGIILAEGKTHARIRKAVSPSMHHEALMGLGRLFLEEATVFAERLGKINKDELDILAESRGATFGIIFRTCFGADVAQQERIAQLQKAYHEAFEAPLWKTFLSAFLSHVFWFVDSRFFNLGEDLHQYIRNTSKELCVEYFQKESRRSSRDERPLLSLMVDADTKKGLSVGEMVDTVLSFLVGGQITTGASICWTLFLLARNPECQNRLLQELKTWREEDGLEALNKLPLLDHVVKESIRLFPPVSNVTRVCVKPTKIDEYVIPKGVAVRLPITSIQRNKEIWGSDADQFNPDRFQNEDLVKETKMFWSAFLFGRRSCIGQRFALLEIKAFAAKIVLQHHVFVENPEDPPPPCIGVFAIPKNLKIFFSPRAK